MRAIDAATLTLAMSRKPNYSCLHAVLLGTCFSLCNLRAAPLPEFTVYGLASDEYGWPCLRDAAVELHLNGTFYQTYAIDGLLAPGVNFVFRIPLDDGAASQPYDRNAAHSGQDFAFYLELRGQRFPLLPIVQPTAIGGAAENAQFNLTAGSDSDGDGLPDQWEWWIIANTEDSAIQSLADINRADDADGDGASNVAEFLAGTNPVDRNDVFRIESMAIQGEMLVLGLWTIPGKTYRLEAFDPSETAPKWMPVASIAAVLDAEDGHANTFSVADPEHAQWRSQFIGDGYFQYAFIERAEQVLLRAFCE